MAKQFDLIVFDWDGTLMDSASAIVTAIQSASQDLGLVVPSDRQARYVIGLGLAEALQHAVPDLPRERVTEMVERYRHRKKKNNKKNTPKQRKIITKKKKTRKIATE